MIRNRAYRSGNLVAEDFDARRVSEYLAEPDTVVWVDVCEPQPADVEMLAGELSLNPLAVEDALHPRQRPKVDRYVDHLFLSLYDVQIDSDTGELAASELAAFVAPRYLITVRKTGHFDIAEVVRRWDASPDLAKHGVGFLLYGLLDVVVDSHFETVQRLDDAIEEVESLLFEPSAQYGPQVQRRSFELRKSLVLLRRLVVPTREVVNTLMRGEHHLVDEAMVPYYQDVYDHVLRAADWTDSLRDLVSTILETNLTIQGNRLNEIMKKVTSWAAIIAVPTAITGYYGMNVRIFPVAGSLTGGVFALVLMVVLSGALYLLFRARDWL